MEANAGDWQLEAVRAQARTQSVEEGDLTRGVIIGALEKVNDPVEHKAALLRAIQHGVRICATMRKQSTCYVAKT